MRSLAAVVPLAVLMLVTGCATPPSPAPERPPTSRPTAPDHQGTSPVATGPRSQGVAPPVADPGARGAAGRRAASGGQGGVRLEGALTSPTDVALRWDGKDPQAAGHVLEFATDPRGPYTILAFLPPGEHAYTHPDLIPDTTFHYRLRPYRGRASAAVDVTAGGGPYPEPGPGWSQPRTVPGGPRRALPTGGGGAAPADLRATVVQADGVAFTWTDRAADEDGLLLENRPAGRTGFRVVALLDPDVNAFGLITLPEERRAAYRVRAFRYGTPSNVVELATGGS